MEDILDDSWNDYFASKLSITEEQSSITEKQSKQKSNCCNDCGSDFNTFIINSGDLICVQCGLIQESSIICEDPEWNNYVEDGVMNGSGIRCGNVLDITNPYDTGNTFVPKYHWSWHLDAEGNKKYTNLSKIAIRSDIVIASD
jgi:transcription initiation factor TFIIIB Brf1 subunit/transcription initiation factor TFIIB